VAESTKSRNDESLESTGR